jgi:eukaryotic-like serine/threonine-protein kinase
MDTSTPSLDALREKLGGRYAIERELGRGGMGAVYLARDRELDRPVALKVLPPEFALVPDLRERFLRETRTAASFSHPNIVPVFSIEDRDGLLAFAMGFVEGESVTQRVIRSGPFGVRDIVRLLQDIGYALAYAHGRGVVHRDIKPDNIMLERATGRALLMDFGISRTITTQSATPGLTRVGEVVGTPEFMSPEQAAGDQLSGRSDLYSLGLVAWFAATGELAISGESTQKIIVRQITEAIPPIGQRRTDLPAALSAAIDRCLCKDPDDRFESAESLVETLDAAQLAGPEVPLPIRLFAEEASTAALVAIGGTLMALLLNQTLLQVIEGNLDRILPVVLFLAIVWARPAQMLQLARRLALRGFGTDEVQRGFAAILAERDADRAQLRADTLLVARRKRQVVAMVALFALTFVMQWFVLKFQRREIRPDYYLVSQAGAITLYALYVIRGVTIVGVLRSPFRRTVGERLFRLFWLGAPGRLVLRFVSRGIGSTAGGRIVSRGAAVAPVGAAAVHSPARGGVASGADRVLDGLPLEARVSQLERRVQALERD